MLYRMQGALEAKDKRLDVSMVCSEKSLDFAEKSRRFEPYWYFPFIMLAAIFLRAGKSDEEEVRRLWDPRAEIISCGVVEIKRKALQELSALSTTTHSKCLFLREKVAEDAFIDRIHFCL